MIPVAPLPSTPLASGLGAAMGPSQAAFFDFLAIPARGNAVLREVALSAPTGDPPFPQSQTVSDVLPNRLTSPSVFRTEEILVADAEELLRASPTTPLIALPLETGSSKSAPPFAPVLHPYTARVVVSAGTMLPAILNPWRLCSAPGLSYVGVGDATAPHSQTPVTSGEPVMVVAPALTVVSARDSASLLHARLPAWVPLAATAAPVAQARTGLDYVGATSTTESGSLAAQAASPLVWPFRLLRWLNDSQGGTTAWLRDFALDEAGVPTLIAEIVAHTREEGIDLRRIVLNGQERWRAPAPQFLA